jgi:transcriptional regulatory protein LevR
VVSILSPQSDRVQADKEVNVIQREIFESIGIGQQRPLSFITSNKHADGEYGMDCLSRFVQVFREDRALMMSFSRFVQVLVHLAVVPIRLSVVYREQVVWDRAELPADQFEAKMEQLKQRQAQVRRAIERAIHHEPC